MIALRGRKLADHMLTAAQFGSPLAVQLCRFCLGRPCTTLQGGARAAVQAGAFGLTEYLTLVDSTCRNGQHSHVRTVPGAAGTKLREYPDLFEEPARGGTERKFGV